MKLRLKLPLAFACTLLLVVAAALVGIRGLQRALDVYAVDVSAANQNERKVATMGMTFKVQVQEWKNTLLRGQTPDNLEKYWGAFVSNEAKIGEVCGQLMESLPPGELRAQLDRFLAAHRRMGQSYRKGLEAFKASGFQPSVGDVAVRGMDREPTELLERLANDIHAHGEELAAGAAASSKQAIVLSWVLVVLIATGAVLVGLWISRGITRPLERAVDLARAVARGDLSVQLEARGSDEIAQLLAAFVEMQSALSRLVGNVRSGSEVVAVASGEIAQSTEDLSQRTQQQASAAEETTTSMTQLSGAIQRTAASALEADELAKRARAAAGEGGEMARRLLETMRGIDDSAKRIGDITEVIDGIAFQTNILALNASIEAARAGKEGRGFAVVASQVRELSGQCARAAREINDLIRTNIERAQQGTTLVEETGTTMEQAETSMKGVAELIATISAATSEQSAGVVQACKAIDQLEELAQSNAAMAEEMAASSANLRSEADGLIANVAAFKRASDIGARLPGAANDVTSQPSSALARRQRPNSAAA